MTEMKIQSKKDKAIVNEGHPALRQVAETVPLKEITSKHIQNVIADMKSALAGQDDGIGLAAPQIGVPLRIFIVSKKIFSGEISPAESLIKDDKSAGGAHKVNTLTGSKKAAVIAPSDAVFINPVIVKESKEKKWMEGEGCLSVRWVYGKVRRSTKVTLRAYNEHGQVVERGASGLLAHIFQHEVDHLNGILFIDKAKDLEKVDPEEIKKSRKSASKK